MRDHSAWHVSAMRAFLVAAVVLALPVAAAAHITVVPDKSTAAGLQLYTIIVPTEGASPTVRVELEVPAGVDVVAVEPKAGWQAANEPFPIGAATLRWSGGRIHEGEMMTFQFLAVNPIAAGRVLTWNAVQWYEDGTSHKWGKGGDPKHEASTTTLAAAAGGAAHGTHRGEGAAREGQPTPDQPAQPRTKP